MDRLPDETVSLYTRYCTLVFSVAQRKYDTPHKINSVGMNSKECMRMPLRFRMRPALGADLRASDCTLSKENRTACVL